MDFEKRKLLNGLFNNKVTKIVTKSDMRNIKKQAIKSKLSSLNK